MQRLVTAAAALNSCPESETKRSLKSVKGFWERLTDLKYSRDKIYGIARNGCTENLDGFAKKTAIT